MSDHSGDDHRDENRNRRDERDGPHGGSDHGRGGDGPDTRFLQLEMSRVLYGEAQGVTKEAFRELLREATKDHLRKRFGETITRLAEMATEELLSDIEASLDVERQIQRHQESDTGTADRLREVFSRTRPAPGERKDGGRSASRRRRR